MNISDENSLREQLQEAAPPPGNTDIDELVRHGLRTARRRRVLFMGSTAAAAAAAIAFAGVVGFNNGAGPAKNGALPATSHSKNVRPSGIPGTTNLAPIDPACPNWSHKVLVNGQAITSDGPLSLKAGQTIDLQIVPGPGQLAVTDGTAQLVPAQTDAGLTASDTTAVVNGATISGGAITYHVPLTTPAGSALPAGAYILVVPYATPCPAEEAAGGAQGSVGGELNLTVTLS